MSSAENFLAISIQKISKKYTLTNPKNDNHEFWALKDISININKGDTVGLIGANGSGKTTLLKILSGITVPTGGQILQYGKLLSIIDIGSGFHPDLTGRENIFMHGSIVLGMQKHEIANNLSAIIDFAELGSFIDEPVKNYSNGMFLRLALSVALFCNLDILLLDEIFSVGDINFMMKSYERINKLIKQTTTVVFASHNIYDIMRICNKCIWLEKGEIKMQGETNSVIAAYNIANALLIENNRPDDQKICTTKTNWSASNAPGTQDVIITSVYLENNVFSDSVEIFDYNEPVIVVIEYEKRSKHSNIGFALVITDFSGVAILTTSNCLLDLPEQENLNLTGQLKTKCTIPKQLLNSGIYKINLRIMMNKIETPVFAQDILTFKIDSKLLPQKKLLQSTPIKIFSSFVWELTKQ